MKARSTPRLSVTILITILAAFLAALGSILGNIATSSIPSLYVNIEPSPLDTGPEPGVH